MSKFCKYCGAALTEGSKFCKGCGNAAGAQAAPGQQYTHTPPVQPRPQQPAPANQAQPQTTGQLLIYILKQIPIRLMKSIPQTVIVGAGILIMHTYILVRLNNGFNKNADSWYATNVLNIFGNGLSANLLWGLIGALIPLILSFFKKGGNPGKQIAGFFKLPGDIINANKKSGGKFLPVICITVAASLLANNILSGMCSALLGGIVTSSLVSFVTGRGSIFIQLIRQIVYDVQAHVLKQKKLDLGGDSIMVIIGTFGAIMAVMGITRALPMTSGLANLLRYLWIPLLILGIVLFYNNKGKSVPKQFMFFVCLLGTGLLIQQLGIVAFADDGGWTEAGSTFWGWWNSQGRTEALMAGVPPALLGILGSILASIFSGMSGFLPGYMPPAQPQTPSQPQPPGEKLPSVPGYNGGPDDNPNTSFEEATTCKLS